MHKILIEIKKNTLVFSLLIAREKIENLNNTNVVATDKMVFSDNYINNNLDLIKSFFNLVVIKNNITSVDISINAIFPLVYRIIEDINNIKTINLLEDKNMSYIIFEYLLESKFITRVNCYALPSFMLDKLDSSKNIEVNTRCEVLFLSRFMEKNNFSNYEDVYYKKNVEIDCNFEKADIDDIQSFFRFNNRVRVINLFNVKVNSINFILDLIKSNNKRNIKIIINQSNNDKNIVKIIENIENKNRKLLKNNAIKLKVNYTKEYKDSYMMKQINLNFMRLILVIFIILALLATIVFYIKYKNDTSDINAELSDLNEKIDLNQIDKFIEEEKKIEESEEKKEEIVEPPKPVEGETTVKPKPTIQSAYERNFEQVFSKLLSINNETVGWLKVNNTKINYPVTQHKDNNYYLNYSYYKQKNSHGWIFMDYRNKIDKLDDNTIIYGHRNSKGLMFGTLKNVLDKKWYTNKSNQIITFNTLNQDMKWQIFSIYTLKNTNDYLINNFNNDESHLKFIEKIKKRSIYDFKVEVGTDDNILTLSTCYNNAEYRLVVHAKLIKENEDKKEQEQGNGEKKDEELENNNNEEEKVDEIDENNGELNNNNSNESTITDEEKEKQQ